MPCYSPLKGFVNKETGGVCFKRGAQAGAPMEVACGQCLGCRLDYSNTWANRIMQEASLWDENSFITLTYDEEHLPHDGSLVESHAQKFYKRLRKHFSDRTIRYYYCGEYGDDNARPHYHACLFNLDFADKELIKEQDGRSLFTSQTLEKIWGKGLVSVGELTHQSAAYVARYCLKKVTGHNAASHYERVNPLTGEIYSITPEFVRMSRGRPCKAHKKADPECDDCQLGIGRKYFEKFKGDFIPSDEESVPGKGVTRKVSRYYMEAAKETEPDGVEQIKRGRQRFRSENQEEFTSERLMSKYKVKKDAIQFLKREV